MDLFTAKVVEKIRAAVKDFPNVDTNGRRWGKPGGEHDTITYVGVVPYDARSMSREYEVEIQPGGYGFGRDRVPTNVTVSFRAGYKKSTTAYKITDTEGNFDVEKLQARVKLGLEKLTKFKKGDEEEQARRQHEGHLHSLMIKEFEKRTAQGADVHLRYSIARDLTRIATVGDDEEANIGLYRGAVSFDGLTIDDILWLRVQAENLRKGK